MRNLIALVACVALAGAAYGDFTLTGLAGDSAGLAGDLENTTLLYNYAGADFMPNYMTVEGDVTEVQTGTYASEARFVVTDPSMNTFTSGAWTTMGNYTGTFHIDASTQATGLAGTAIGDWSFEMFDSYDDGAGVDQSWSNLDIMIHEDLEPVATEIFYPHQGVGELAAGEIDWYVITLADPIMGIDINTLLTGNLGDPIADTEIGLYDADGFLLANNDDTGGLYSQILGDIMDGTYYIAVGGFNTTFGATGFDVTSTSTYEGHYFLQVIPEPATLALLALGGIALIRRR